MFKFKNRTFKMGGTHLPENKFSTDRPIIESHIPKLVTIPLEHYSGTPAEAIVQKGDRVLVGQLIGRAKGKISANVHSSVSGKVFKIDQQLDASGYKRTAVFIETEGDEWLPEIDRTDAIVENCSLTSAEIIQKIEDAGIVGMGGATFPTHVKLNIPEGKKAELLIINAVECEPYLTCDHRVLMEKPLEILVGTQILMKALNVDKAVIGIENNKKDAIRLVQSHLPNYKGIEVMGLDVKYPQGGEKQLIEAICGKRIPFGKLPIDIGVLMQNVQTTLAVYEAVQKNKPLIERVLTVTGKTLEHPANYRVRLGTHLSEVVAQNGGVPHSTHKIVGGGPMMGRSLMNLEVPMAKGSAGIVFMDEKESYRKPYQHCIRCAKCVDVCPMGLEPYLLMQLGEKEFWDKMDTNRTIDCIECGLCNYVCPSNRPMLDFIRYGKSVIIQEQKKKQTNG